MKGDEVGKRCNTIYKRKGPEGWSEDKKKRREEPCIALCKVRWASGYAGVLQVKVKGEGERCGITNIFSSGCCDEAVSHAHPGAAEHQSPAAAVGRAPGGGDCRMNRAEGGTATLLPVIEREGREGGERTVALLACDSRLQSSPSLCTGRE